MSDPLVTFVIATIDRSSLRAAVQSVLNQTIPVNLIVAGDGNYPTNVVDEAYAQDNVLVANYGQNRHEALTRNLALEDVTTPWVAYLDDDDEVDPHYAFQIQQVIQSSDPDVIIFQQTFPSREPDQDVIKVFPDPGVMDLISWGNVGISYAVKTEWAKKFPFKITKHEDLLNLVALEAAGAKFAFLPWIGYFGRGARLG